MTARRLHYIDCAQTVSTRTIATASRAPYRLPPFLADAVTLRCVGGAEVEGGGGVGAALIGPGGGMLAALAGIGGGVADMNRGGRSVRIDEVGDTVCARGGGVGAAGAASSVAPAYIRSRGPLGASQEGRAPSC
jgi:hypothetical protein